MSEEFEYIGKRIPRIESIPKATGSIKYLDDMTLPGMLYGKFLRSPHPHARVVKIDVSKAESLPGVKLILTPDDIIGKIPCLGAFPPRTKHALEREVRYVGDEVVAVAAVDEETAEKAVGLIDVEYEELPVVLDPEEAMKPGALQLHKGTKNNIADQKSTRIGDVEKAFKEADYVVKDRFQTSKQAHVCLETHGCLSSYDPSSGKLTHWAGTQGVHNIRFQLAGVLNMPSSKVRVICPEAIGGGFGAKYEVFSWDVCAALMSMRLRRPVKMVLSREEVFMSTTTRHPFTRESEIGLKKDGTIVAWKEKVIMDVGAYNTNSPWVALVSHIFTPVPFKIPNVWIDSYAVYTNKSISAGFRGFGIPQAGFARESLIDIAAEKMGIDRVELRLRNIIKPENLPCTTSSGLIVRSCGIEEAISRATDAVGWGKKKPNTGVGLACGLHATSAKTGGKMQPFFGPPVVADSDFGSAVVDMAPDGTAIVRTGASDIGQGIYTALAQIAAEELGIPLENVTVVGADSEITPFGLGTFGSRGACFDGSAVKRAAEEVKAKLLRVAGKMLEVSPGNLEARRGEIYVKDEPSKAIAVADVASMAYYTAIDGPAGPIMGRGIWSNETQKPLSEEGYGNMCAAYGAVVNTVKVEVDPETGQVKLLKLVGAKDPGRALNPLTLEGSAEGGLAQGIGYGMLEETYYDMKTGQPLNPLLIDYKVPTAADLPVTQVILVENVDPGIPLGNKGGSEMAMDCVAPAIANAIYDAVGVRIKELPITPAKILQSLKKKSNILANKEEVIE